MSVTDLHNHLIPGVDDGARTDAEAEAALLAMVAAGVDSIIVTPHLNGSLSHEPRELHLRLAEIDEGWARLQAIAARCGAQVQLARGTEVMLDTPDPDLTDDRMRLAGGRFVLLEFPFMTVPPQAAPALQRIRGRGWLPIVAHPERYRGVTDITAAAQGWREAGAALQVNGAALLGRYGEDARKAAWRLLRAGLVDYLASDYHARGEVPIRAYRDALAAAGGEEQMELLTNVNPRRVLAGEPPLPVLPLPARGGFMARLLKWR